MLDKTYTLLNGEGAVNKLSGVVFDYWTIMRFMYVGVGSFFVFYREKYWDKG